MVVTKVLLVHIWKLMSEAEGMRKEVSPSI